MYVYEEKNIFKIDRRGVVNDVDTANLSSRSFLEREREREKHGNFYDCITEHDIHSNCEEFK